MLLKKFIPVVMALFAIIPPSLSCAEGDGGLGRAGNDPQSHVVDTKSPVQGSFDPAPPVPTLLVGNLQPKFINMLPNALARNFILKPVGKTRRGVDYYKIERRPFVANLGIVNAQNRPLFTPMFGYASEHETPTFPGKTFLVSNHKPIKVFWKNNLVNKKNGAPLPLLRYVPVDQTIHLAMPEHPPYPKSGVPTVVHLHGGFTEELSDGYPEAWNTPHFAQKGPFLKKKVFTYSNRQEPTMLWYHDHALGITRLNNYAGLVGAYVIRGNPENRLVKEHKLPSSRYEVPLIITDKMFTANGELFFPYIDNQNPKAPRPTVLPEFFGDFILVNGKAWPFVPVEPRQYRLRILNGCDSRFLDLRLVEDQNNPAVGVQFYQVGTDQGLLNKPVAITHLLIAPGQRADLVVDFSQYKHKTLVMTNTANAPYPDGDPVDPLSTGLVMSFKVTKKLNTDYPLSHLPKKLRHHPIKRLQPTAKTRQVLLFETKDGYGRIMPMLGTPALGMLEWHQPVTETPLLGTTEIWEIYNTTGDAHPIHLHAGDFQILDRQNFTGDLDPITGVLTNIQLLGPSPIGPTEHGLFDTAIVYPGSGQALGQMTRIIMKFSLPGHYVWHCHILSHEDHDMMRPLLIRKK